MKKNKWGRVINIGSSSSYNGFKGTAAYCASKHALLGLSRSLYSEWKEFGIRVLVVSPGSLKTEMGRKVEGQDFETFIETEELASFILQLMTHDDDMIVEEVRVNRVFVQ